MPLVNDKVSSFRVAELAQPLFERLEERWWNWSRSEHADAQGFRCLLRLSGERRKSEADRENDREPDPPHGHLGGDGWREV